MKNYIRRRLFEHEYVAQPGALLVASAPGRGPDIRHPDINTIGFGGGGDQVVTYVREDITQIDPARLDPAIRHRGIGGTRFEGVGNWILKTSVFREWMGGEGGANKAVLFCSGNPGVGKTYLR